MPGKNERNAKDESGREPEDTIRKDGDLIEEPVSSEEIYRGKIVHLFRDTVRLPNGRLATREVMRHAGAVCIVPLTEEGDVVMVRQYRHPFSKVLLEAPAGKLDAGETPEACARRELSEETGAEAGELEYIGDYYPSVAVLNENIRLYIARKLTFRSAHTDEDEFLRVERIPLKTLVGQVLDGEICDGKTQTAILKTWLLEQTRQS